MRDDLFNPGIQGNLENRFVIIQVDAASRFEVKAFRGTGFGHCAEFSFVLQAAHGEELEAGAAHVLQ